MAMRLGDLIAGLGRLEHGSPDTIVTGLSSDSRAVRPGDLFAALPGSKVDGLAYAPGALERGAAVVLAGRVPGGRWDLAAPLVLADEPRRALALMAARLHAPQPETIVAVTGTSGKTSVASFTRAIFAACGHAAASLGTLGLVAPNRTVYGSLTTPDPIELTKTLATLASEGVTHVAMEASSHGLDQYRLDGVSLTAAAFTNLSRDHLDYHPTVEAYLSAKLRLTTDLLPPGKTMVVNADGGEAARAFVAAAKRGGHPVLTVGEHGDDVKLLSRRRVPGGQMLSLGGAFGRAEVKLPLAGDFQAANALVAAGLALAAGCPAARVIAALETLEGVPGRLDKVGEVAGAAVYIDYSHKPDALANVLKALRPYTTGRLIVAFGCGGDRDPGKRPIMGEIAARDADVVIVTDDNPRSEVPAAIRAAILAAAPGATEVGDRAAAIAAGVDMLRAGDVFVVAGKGHESGQIVGGVTLPFSDHDVARAAISAREARA
jgi:UDP-N-acetylmuramoyl-L-alanyl-D-glutamate--2,6-diaminopimelate ligase